MNVSNKFEIDLLSNLSRNAWNLFDKSEARNGQNSVEHDQKLIRYEEYHDECIYQALYQFPRTFVWKCMKTTKSWPMGRTDQQMDEQKAWSNIPLNSITGD